MSCSTARRTLERIPSQTTPRADSDVLGSNIGTESLLTLTHSGGTHTLFVETAPATVGRKAANLGSARGKNKRHDGSKRGGKNGRTPDFFFELRLPMWENSHQHAMGKCLYFSRGGTSDTTSATRGQRHETRCTTELHSPSLPVWVRTCGLDRRVPFVEWIGDCRDRRVCDFYFHSAVPRFRRIFAITRMQLNSRLVIFLSLHSDGATYSDTHFGVGNLEGT